MIDAPYLITYRYVPSILRDCQLTPDPNTGQEMILYLPSPTNGNGILTGWSPSTTRLWAYIYKIEEI